MNNNPRPTCKAVKRPNQRGARIHPRGCRVRYILHDDGTIRKNAKADNRLKPAKQTIELQGEQHFKFKAHVNNSRATTFLWDTGATNTSMSRRTARKLNFLVTTTSLSTDFRGDKMYILQLQTALLWRSKQSTTFR